MARDDLLDAGVDRGAFGPVLRRLRLAANITQEELASRARLSVESISALERGRRRAPYRETIAMLADGLNLSTAEREELAAAAQRPSLPSRRVTHYDSAEAGAQQSNLALSSKAREDAVQAAEKRHNLRRLLSSFHGRVDDLEKLRAHVAQHRLVSVVGAGGIGKTRIAIELAWTLLEQYEDGVWFVDLAPLLDEQVIVTSVLEALGIAASTGRENLETLVAHLKGRTTLIIIDNCEHVIAAVAVLAESLLTWCPKVRIFATSREPLHVSGERVYRLHPLDFPTPSSVMSAQDSLHFGAISLFVERATATNAAFAYTDTLTDTTANICIRLDGIALAIELAASHSAVLTPAEILTQLETHFNILRGGSRTALPRQQTMREAVRWSYDRLNDSEKLVFRYSAVFINGFFYESLQALSASTIASSADVFEILVALVNKSLIVATNSGALTRYRLLEPIRAFGLEMQNEFNEQYTLQQAFAQWCLALVHEAHDAWENRPTSEWYLRFEPEMDNLRSGLFWALDQRNDIALGQELAATARRFWARTSAAEGQRWIGKARAGLAKDASPSTVAALALADAHIHIMLRQYGPALSATEVCALMYTQIDEPLASAEARCFAGLALAHLGRVEEGTAIISASIETFERLRALQLTAHGLNELAIAHFIRGDLDGARQFFSNALTLFRTVQNDRGIESVSANLAEIEFGTGDAEAAVQLCAEALSTSHNGREASIYRANMAAYLIKLGRFDEARFLARTSILARRVASSATDVAFPIQHLAAIAALRPTEFTDQRADGVNQAAALLGFVDSLLTSHQLKRQFTEQQEYEQITRALRLQLSETELVDLFRRGESWTHEEATRQALNV